MNVINPLSMHVLRYRYLVGENGHHWYIGNNGK